ncbi:fibroblast growth factor 19 [Ambystoma mexicanum]|uniref:fibroblast growth factor 19 n=1 Tax=Ambystoma mexicanum TaxID=8296 RepID=UPI0037E73973
MWWGQLQWGCQSLALALLSLAALSQAMPFDAGPHMSYEWGETIRLRHLYTASRHGQRGCYLRISEDGTVDAARRPCPHSLLEIRAVSANAVVIKGYQSSRFLCMESDGKLRGQYSYSADDCSFEEKIQPDGYNTYTSKKYGISVSLAKDRQRPHCTGQCFLPFSHFLLIINNVPLEPKESVDKEYASPLFIQESPFHQLSFLDSIEGLGDPTP